MKRLELVENLTETLILAGQGAQSELWTALPGIVQSFDPVAMTVTVQPALQARLQAQDGTFTWMPFPVLVDVPVVFSSGGGYTLTYPIANGDEALVVFASRCIDTWWQTGGYNNIQAELRMHSLSDGFAFIGPRSQARKLANISTTSVQLRSDDGVAFVEVAAGHVINITTTANVNVTTTANANITAGTAIIKAASIILQNAGTALRKLVNDAFIALFNAHVHSGVATGAGNTGVPTVAMSATQTTSVVQAE